MTYYYGYYGHKATPKANAVAVFVALLLILAFWGAVGYVAVHFISKWW